MRASVSALTTRGFGQDDLEEGWTLLRNVAKGHFDYLPTETTDPSVILELDLWENTWFPIAEAKPSPSLPAHRGTRVSQLVADGGARRRALGRHLRGTH